ncbi:MAG: beta-lactamase family protein [Caulobacter sp.]|nr:beta-lactamase family protein [Caulobacter sp.]
MSWIAAAGLAVVMVACGPARAAQPDCVEQGPPGVDVAALTGPVRAVIAREMPASGAPGLAFAIVRDGTVVTGACGLARLGTDRRVTPDTPFLLGSISKSFTAMAVLQLVEAGKVDLDAEVSRYLPVFRGRPGQAITIRQLLSHTSGWSTLQGNQPRKGKGGDEDELARRVAEMAQWTPAKAPGERWAYSNANYLILGAVIEAVSGQSYQAYVESRILKPLGMDHSFVVDGRAHDDMATGHLPWFGGKRPLDDSRPVRSAAPAGGVVASAGDLARYLAVMMNGRDDVISAGHKALMMRPAGKASPFYGLGWFIDAKRGRVSHSGTSPGVETLATLVPGEKTGVVVLVNAGGGVGFGETTRLREGLTARALGGSWAGDGGRWGQKALFASLVLLPVIFLLCMVWAWFHRRALRAKSGLFGLFSLWFPLLTTTAIAVAVLFVIPDLLGVSAATLRMFQPDLALTLTAIAVTGVGWAVFRLLLAYSGRGKA